ncbi:LEAF RUST 10 DISEASE-RESISTANCEUS RECEPTOR-LIKE PROTEIN KINASE-like 2.4 isoform X1 [Aegilops tauschii subsp. strangulata]|uniref:LEAF RUST 10 DISEASE-RESISTANCEUS RECEPTOR-LIKE PROTEIN KINASE-like 2.4 isoform X1 n=1 Tax=Aegilops tauschii subsp. strangulata TaxID=200361 RepID=UPI00098B92D5|nr:LEAF RUST 10 DISEASE-RESISTANCE LOCUS RECEPTOR-LIKE PROTEIN KINASE-like 2.4 isoform X2 [Aegilops tauschii subsp. strangulata]
MAMAGWWFLIFVAVWWLPLPLTPVVAEEQQGEDCSDQKCGNINISDPFWLTDKDTGRSCSSDPYLDFDVACLNNSYPVLRSAIIFNKGFKILNISYQERSFYAVDLGKLNILQSSNSCLSQFYNTSIKLNHPFTIAPVNLNLILYNCTEKDGAAAAASRDRALAPTRVRCPNEWVVLARAGVPHDTTGNYSNYARKGCAAVVVPVLGSSSGASAGDYEQLFSDGFLLTWDPPPHLTIFPRNERRGKKIMLIGTTSAAATFLCACLYVLIWHRKGKRLWFLLCNKASSNTEKNYEAMIVSYGSLAPKRYMYSEVMKITSRNEQLGKGGYGVVFKGRLYDGRLVAVKFLHDCKGNGDEFVNEVISIGRTSHVNVVSLFGYCLEGSKRALIYEYMPNGSLDKYIYSKNPKEILGWERLYATALGIARGLEYLHHSCNTRIVHFDIKPQNILLDKDFCPKIADFGLAKLCHTKESKLSMTGARGTIGFIAPEVHSRTFGVVSTKSDVYSYGMMLLEMVGGRRNVKSIVENSSEKYFPDWIYDHFAQDDGLQACEITREMEEIARKMTLIGLWCIQILPAYRPTITKVLEMFERSSDDMDMPPKQNFSGLIENSAHNYNVQSASSTRSEEI